MAFLASISSGLVLWVILLSMAFSISSFTNSGIVCPGSLHQFPVFVLFYFFALPVSKSKPSKPDIATLESLRDMPSNERQISFFFSVCQFSRCSHDQDCTLTEPEAARKSSGLFDAFTVTTNLRRAASVVNLKLAFIYIFKIDKAFTTLMFSMRYSLIFLGKTRSPGQLPEPFLTYTAKGYAAIFPAVRTCYTKSLRVEYHALMHLEPLLEGGYIPYFSFNSSVVICPCFKIWSITVLGRFAVTVLQKIKNSFGYFCGITSSGLHQNKLFCFPFSVEIR